jgi:hypothetical protein
MSILGPDGEAIEGQKPHLAVAAGASLELVMSYDGVIETPDSILDFERGHWIIVPMETWRQTLTKLMRATTALQACDAEVDRLRRRKDKRNGRG